MNLTIKIYSKTLMNSKNENFIIIQIQTSSFLKKNDDVTTRAFNNDIKRNVNTHNDRNNNVCVYYKKKDY